MAKKKSKQKVGTVLIRVHGELKGPFTFAQLRGWIATRELQNCVPAKFIGDPAFKALQTLEGWHKNPDDIEYKLPRLIEMEATREYHIRRQKSNGAGLKVLIVLAVIALIIGGAALGGLYYYKGLTEKREIALQAARDQFVSKELEACLAHCKAIRNDLHLFEWPTLGKVRMHEGLAYLELGKRKEAQRAFGAIALLHYQSDETKNIAAAGIAMAAKKAKEAEEEARRILKTDKMSLHGNYILAGTLSGRSGPYEPDYNTAIQHYTRLINNYKGRVFHYRLAEVYKRKHDFANAAHVYESLIDQEAVDTDILVKLALCYLELDEKDSAMEAFRLAKSIDPSLDLYLNE